MRETEDERLPLRECGGCYATKRSNPLAHDDTGGEITVYGPDCPECDIPMDFVYDPARNGRTTMPIEPLTGRELDAAVGRIVGAMQTLVAQPAGLALEWPAYSRYLYPLVLDWLAGQGVHYSLTCAARGHECDIEGDDVIHNERAATAGEAVCRAVLAWKERRKAVANE